MLLIKNRVYDGIIFSLLKEVKFTAETAIKNRNIKSLPHLCSRNLPIKIVEIAAFCGYRDICEWVYIRKLGLLYAYRSPEYRGEILDDCEMMRAMRKFGVLAGLPEFFDIPNSCSGHIDIYVDKIDMIRMRPILLYNSCNCTSSSFHIIHYSGETQLDSIKKYCKYNIFRGFGVFGRL